MMTKYGFEVDSELNTANKKRLINQLWKLIPMREKAEDWSKQLDTVLIEISGLNNIFISLDFLILLTKLEGLKSSFAQDDFLLFRKTVFDSIDLLAKLYE